MNGFRLLADASAALDALEPKFTEAAPLSGSNNLGSCLSLKIKTL